MRGSEFLCLCALVFLQGCADIIPINYEALRTADTGNTQDHINLLRQQSEQVVGMPFTAGNNVEILLDGAQTYHSMLTAIAAAEKRIDMESFLFDNKEGEQFANALIGRSKAGVAVYLIYDAWGSSDTDSFLFDRMRQAGIRVMEYNPVDAASFLDMSVNHRDHRKLLLIDGETAFVGGINISDVYRLKLRLKQLLNIAGDTADPNQLPWRDTHVKINGPAVEQFERLFVKTWRQNNKAPIEDAAHINFTHRKGLLVQAVEESPTRNIFAFYRSLLMAIALAQRSVHLTTGFFVPPTDLRNALRQAAERGVDVTLILPSRNDSDLALEAGHATYENLLESGVKIYEYQGAILHAKTGVIDGIWSTVGSFNLDWRSAALNDECNAIILDKNFAVQLEAVFQEDIKHSILVDRNLWQERPLLEKINEWKSSFFKNLL